MGRNESFSIGYTTMQSHEKRGSTPVVTLNYIGPDHRLPLPYPSGDWYLRQTAIPAARSGEIVVVNTLIPGLLDYYGRIGLLPSDTKARNIIEVEPGENVGFPHTDSLERLRGEVIFEASSPLTLISTFSGSEVTSQADSLGLESLSMPESFLTNDKARLRQKAEAYGIRMLPGAAVNDWDEFNAIENRFGHLEHGVWIKAPTGSGGDLVYHVREVATENLGEGRDRIRSAVAKSFVEGQFRTTIDEYWQRDHVAPSDTALVVESDARNLGEILVNGSTQFVTHRSGDVEVVGHFEQLTSEEGEYLGNRPYIPDRLDEADILDQVNRVAQLSHDEGYYGIQGVDWFLLRTPQGETIAYIVERNARPTANTPPVIIADKLDAPSWININAYTDTPIRTIDDYLAVVGEELAYGNPQENGLVIPQAFRTKVTRQSIDASPNFKILILGKDAKHCDNISMTLRERGIRFTP